MGATMHLNLVLELESNSTEALNQGARQLGLEFVAAKTEYRGRMCDYVLPWYVV